MTDAGEGVEIAGATDRGQTRERNEDHLALDRGLGVAVVADGMGGLPHGDVASREAVAAVMTYLRAASRPAAPASLTAALSAANQRVRERAGSQGGSLMGTTAVVAGIDGSVCRIAYAGDSRAYRYRRGELALLTRDHSMVQDMVDRGLLSADAARSSPGRNVITRAVGLEAEFEADSVELTVEAGDLLLLCSDGFWDMLSDVEIAALLAGCGAGQVGLEGCVDVLVAAANDAGGLDNITVVLARVP